MTVLYALDRVIMRYGARTVLSIPQLTINEGETLILIGPSGAGKSTLLRLLCFLESPTSGSISYAGELIRHAPPLTVQREVTLVFQRPLLLDTTVWRNVAYGLRIRDRQDDALIQAMLDLLGLQNLAHERALKLSGGEMQRVALARALVLQPRVLLMDEPTAQLDPANVVIIEQAITMLRQKGTTVVMATHHLHQARRLSSHIAFLLDGQLIEAGPAERIFKAPKDRRTQAFLSGDMIY
jgi:tungstate transport system ATP-binding protein